MVKNKLFIKKNQLGFTMLEMLLVISILVIIITLGLTSYSRILISSRDSTRKSDIQQISNVLEQYKSNNEFGSYPNTIYQNSDFTKYMTNIPTDPSTSQEYEYEPLPLGCTPSINAPCISYNLTAVLEKDMQEYKVNPYGEE
ncbi:MAG: prepilin-type N-terminal cleavage/methylation domain-containing protein [Patescibacteria group bacterium]